MKYLYPTLALMIISIPSFAGGTFSVANTRSVKVALGTDKELACEGIKHKTESEALATCAQYFRRCEITSNQSTFSKPTVVGMFKKKMKLNCKTEVTITGFEN